MPKPARDHAPRVRPARARGGRRAREATPRRARASLAELLGEVSEQRFFADFYEKAPLHVTAGAAGRYAGLLDVEDLDTLFAAVEARGRDDLLLVRRGRRLGPMPDDPLLYVPHLRAGLASGYSIVLYHVGRFWPPIAALVRELAERLECPVHAALFLTPPAAQGFVRHFDCADLLVLQLAGSKEWRVHAPEVELPLQSQERPIAQAGSAASARVVRLAAGDLLYLPRGFAHAAVAGADASLHLSIYFEPYLWRDLLHDLVDEAAERDVALRRSRLPEPVGAEMPAAPPLVARVLEQLGAGAAERGLERSRERLVERLAAIAPESRGGAAVARLVSASDRVERVMGQIGAVRRHGDGLRLTFPGGALRVPAKVEPAVRFMAAARGAFPVRALPGDLSERTKLSLVRRLVKAGFLRRAVTADPGAA